MDIWIPITILAALSQTIRTAIQRQMKGRLGDYGASAIRFIYAVPFAWFWFFLVLNITNQSMPTLNLTFFIWTSVGGIAQIFFTILLVKLFSYKNFLVGVALSKTEVIFAALIEAIIISAAINLQFGIALIAGTVAVILLSIKGNSFAVHNILSSIKSKATYIGILSGSTLAVSVIAFRLAVNSLNEGDFLIRATTTAAIGVVGQSIAMTIYLSIYRKPEFTAVFNLWKPSLIAGFFAAITTASWFSAFALYRAAPVRAVGQVELIFSTIITIFIFRQNLNRIEIVGLLLLILSILLVVFD
jgi:drug/metabolite transporter (DMT)-like permease